ncbi:hypothetical protein Rhopal_002884-T1 [Rhodotorula paludigena]|uniref:UNC-45/Cro1/She4 central domain-containing protein n=1 Tax=Rhodotorula paludigena TaxID=86838 RepID=A0AAV5GK70_9BASI|nr:hypothetical protein Rhopal_002884-T1 [Rhodotorula paludigena]
MSSIQCNILALLDVSCINSGLNCLHLFNQEPQLHLPDSTPDTAPQVAPEPWVWRFPAAIALHDILRILLNPTTASNPRLADTLLPVAVRIARQSLRFDTIMWDAVLAGQKREAARGAWRQLVEHEQAIADGDDEGKVALPQVTLSKRRREKAAAPSAQAWERDYGAAAEDPAALESQWRTIPGFDDASATDVTPPSSRRHRKRAHWARVAACDPAHSPPAPVLALSLAISRLRRRRSPAALKASIQLALEIEREDLAAQFCAEWIRHADPALAHAQLTRLLKRISLALRPAQRKFEATPSVQVLAAVVHLAGALDGLLARIIELDSAATRRDVLGPLIHLLAKFPPAPPVDQFSRGSLRRRRARAHAEVSHIVDEVLRRLLQDVIGRELRIERSRISLGKALSPPPAKLPLALYDFNALISYATLRWRSPEVGFALLERMSDVGIAPSPETHTILFTALGDQVPSARRAIEAADGDPYAVSHLLAQMVQTSSFDELDELVFRLLPELNHESQPSEALATSSPSFAARPPPSSGRNPHVYTALLHALACAGRVGLAERVFRNARWAAERSRTRSHGRERKGWVLPEKAYTHMLQLYAGEVRRGRMLERRDARAVASGAEEGELGDGDASRFVRGWGRHALRVFLLQERRARLEAELAGGASSSSLRTLHAPATDAPPSSTNLRAQAARYEPIPPFPRAEAAPIVAIWELEGGSRGPELESLKKAMRSPHSQDALRVLFPSVAEADARALSGGKSDDLHRRMSREGLKQWRWNEKGTVDVDMAPSSSSSVDELKAMLSRPSPLDLTCDDLDKLLSALKTTNEQRTLALAVFARFFSPSPTSTTRSALQDALESRLSGSDSAELVEGLSALSGVLQVAPAVAASLLQLDSLRSRLEEAVELISRPVGKGKAKQDDERLALVELLSLAAGQPSMRGLVRSSAGDWLEGLLGSPSDEAAGAGTEAKRTALAGVAVVKLRLGKEEPSTTGLPTADTGGSPSRWTLEDLARLFVRLVASRKDVALAEDVLLPCLEALAYLTLAPSPPVKKIATDSSFLATLFSLAPKTATAPTVSDSARDYAVATLLDHLAVFPSPAAQGDAAQVERLKRFAAAAAQKGDAESPAQPETGESVAARVGLLVRHDPSPIPTTRRLAARILHSFVTPQSLRGELLQAGVARLFLSLIRQLPAPFSPAHDTPAVQGLAKLCITANPLLIFGGSPSAPLLLEATSALTLPLAVSASSDGGPASLLATFESLMALTNAASLDPALTEQLTRLELRDRPSSANKLLDVVSELLLSSNTMVRRAATELVCNLAASDAGIADFEPPQAAPLNGPKPPSAKLHVVLALASSPDEPTRLAASGALTSLVYSPRIALALCAFAKWREMLLVLCRDDVPGVRHRVYEVWRVLAEVVEQLPDAKERESARKGIEDGKVRAALETAAQAEKVVELRRLLDVATVTLTR